MLKHAKHFLDLQQRWQRCSSSFLFFVQPERITDASWIDNRDRNALSVLNEPENSIDVLVLGDSESFTSISPYRSVGKTENHILCLRSDRSADQRGILPHEARISKTTAGSGYPETNELFTHANLVEELRMAVTETGKYYVPVFSYHNQLERPVLFLQRRL